MLTPLVQALLNLVLNVKCSLNIENYLTIFQCIVSVVHSTTFGRTRREIQVFTKIQKLVQLQNELGIQ